MKNAMTNARRIKNEKLKMKDGLKMTWN